MNDIREIWKALSEELTSDAFLKEAGVRKAVMQMVLNREYWEEQLTPLFPITRRISCKQIYDIASPAMHVLSEEPEEGWMPFTYRFACHILYPEDEFTRFAAPYRAGAVFYLTVLRFIYDIERQYVPFNPLKDFVFLTDEEAEQFDTYREYRRFKKAWHKEYVYEMMRLNAEVTVFNTLEHIAGVHYVAMKVARGLYEAGAPVDLAMMSAAAAGHDIGKFGCKPNENVPYMHYYYTDIWFRAHDIPYSGHVAANHSSWDLEPENLSAESLILIYSDFRVKQSKGPDGISVTNISSLADAFDIILNKLDNVDEKKKLRYRFVYAKLADFEKWMIARGVDVDLDDDPPAPEQLPDVVLRTPEQIVRSLTFMAIEHNIAVMHRMSAERQFGELLEAARSEKHWKNVRAYLNILRQYFTYTSDAQKERMLSFLYELFMHRDGEIRVQAADVLGQVIAQFNAGYRKRRPEGIGDAAQEHVMKLWNDYIDLVLHPDRKLIELQRERINSQLKNILMAVVRSAEPDDLPLFMAELLKRYDEPEKMEDPAAFVLLNAVQVFPFDRMSDDDLARAARFAIAKRNSSQEHVRTSAYRAMRQISEFNNSMPVCEEIFEAAREGRKNETITELFLRCRVITKLGKDASELEDKLYNTEFISDIFLDNLKTTTPWIVKTVNIKLLADQVNHGKQDQAMHVAAHFSNMIKVGDYMLVRTTAGEALLKLMPFLTDDQKNEIAVEMLHGLLTGGTDYSRSIPQWLGQVAMWLPPEQIDEIIAEFTRLTASPEDRVVSVVLDTVGVMAAHYPEYRKRFPAEDEVHDARLSRIVGLILVGMSSYREHVRQEAMLVLGTNIFDAESFTRQEKENIFERIARKILFQLTENNDGELTQLYRAAALSSVYRFITAYRILEGEFHMQRRRRVAYFPGTFDPFTLSHKGIAMMIRDMGFEVYLSVDEFSWSKKAQPYYVRRQIVNMSMAEELHVNLFPASLPLNPGCPDDMRKLKALFPDQEVYMVVGSDVIANASYYRNPEVKDEICRMNHIAFRRVGDAKTDSLLNREIVHIIRGDLIELELPRELEEISSTRIRENIDRNRDISDLIDPVAEEYIYNQGIYLREPEYKPVVQSRDVFFEEETTGDVCRLSVKSGKEDEHVIGTLTYRLLAPDVLYSVLKDVERADMIRRHTSGRILLVTGLKTVPDEDIHDADTLLLAEAAVKSYGSFCETAVYYPDSAEGNRSLHVFERLGFVRINPVKEEIPVMVADMRDPLLVLQNMDTVVKEPFNHNQAVLHSIRKAQRNMQKALADLYPGQLVIPIAAGVLYQRLVDRITELNRVPKKPSVPRRLGELMCVPFGKIIRSTVVPNTVTKTLHTDRVYEPDLMSNRIEAFPGYTPLRTQIRTIHSFRRPVILVDDVLNRSGLRIGTIEPLLREEGVDVRKVLLGVLTGYGKDTLESMGFDADSVYFIPNMRYWFMESSLYPFIGGDTVRRKEMKVSGLAPSINLIQPYTQPPLEGADPEALFRFSVTCLENTMDILRTLEKEYRGVFARNLTLSRLPEAVNLPICPDRGAFLCYDPNLPASSYIEGDLEMLRRTRVNTREAVRRRNDL